LIRRRQRYAIITLRLRRHYLLLPPLIDATLMLDAASHAATPIRFSDTLIDTIAAITRLFFSPTLYFTPLLFSDAFRHDASLR